MLYFDNASRDSADAYLADGLTEEIILRLQQVRRLEVKSRFESQRVRARARGAAPAALGRELRARYLVNGSLQRAGDRVVVRVELTRADRGVGVWSERFDRTAANVLDVIDDVARGVATGVAGQLLPAEAAELSRRPTADAEAYQHFLRGNFHLAQRNAAALAIAGAEYQAAATRDPSFKAALARVAYAHTLGLALGYGRLSREALLVAADSSVTRARLRAADVSDTWLAHGFYLLMTSFLRLADSIPAGVASLERAVALDAGSPEAHHQYAQGLVFLWRLDESEREYRRALALEPGRAVTFQELAYLALMRSRVDEARAWADSATAADPRNFRSYIARVRVAVHRNDLADAERELSAAEALGRGQEVREEEVHVMRALIRRARGDSADIPLRLDIPLGSAVHEAQFVVLSREQALDWIESIQVVSYRCVLMRQPLAQARLRDEPRFIRLLADCR